MVASFQREVFLLKKTDLVEEYKNTPMIRANQSKGWDAKLKGLKR